MMLENNIQMALQQQNIELEDAIDLRMIKNVNVNLGFFIIMF